MTTSSHHAPHCRVHPQRKVLAGIGRDEICCHGATALTTRVHEGGVAKCVVLLVVGVIRDHLLPVACLETAGEDIVTLVSVELSISGWVSSAWNQIKDALLGSGDVLGFPARGEIVIPVIGVRLEVQSVSNAVYNDRVTTYLPPESCVDSSSASEDTASHLVHVCARNSSRVNPDLVAQSRNVEAGKVSAGEPAWLHGSVPPSRGWGTLLNKQHTLAGGAKLVRDGDTTGTSTDDNIVVRLL